MRREAIEITIRDMQKEDWDSVATIYKEGIETKMLHKDYEGSEWSLAE